MAIVTGSPDTLKKAETNTGLKVKKITTGLHAQRRISYGKSTPATTPMELSSFSFSRDKDVRGVVDRISEELSSGDVIVWALKNRDYKDLDAIESLIRQLWVLVRERLDDLNETRLKTIIDALTPNIPLADDLLEEASRIAQLRTRVIESTKWLTAAQVSQMAGYSSSNPSTQPNKWKKGKQIFAVFHNGIDYFPGYTLDEKRGYKPITELKEILLILEDTKDSWGIAYWFASANSFLNGKKPQELLASHPLLVIKAAKEEAEGIDYG